MSFEQFWQERFGAAPPLLFSDLERLAWHRSIRSYADREVSEGLVQTLIGIAQSAATSSNLQLWSVISIQNAITRDALATLSDNYEHIRKAPWFFAFIADHFRLKSAAAAVGEAAEGLDFSEFFIMAVIDAALAAERLVCAAETLGHGICYIGAMRNNAPGVKRLLHLPKHTFCPFGLCLGWPAEPLEAHIKPRLNQEAVWFKESYRTDAPIEEYDRRMSAFYAREGMKGEVTWSMRSGRRVDEHHLTGREILKTWLEEQDFNLR